jgi:hypothetical protein
MSEETKHEKIKFWTNWTLLSFGIIPLSYIVSLIAVLLVQGAFGFGQMDWGTPLSNTLSQIAGGTIIGLGTGLYQKSLLQKACKVSSSWIYSLIIGFVTSELIAGIILWQLDLDREKLRFIEDNPLPETLIFASAGLLTGFLQWRILKRFFFRSGCWVIASTLGWGICILINILWFIPFIHNSVLAVVMVFSLGSLLYGVITGTTLIWIMRRKE